jgi:cell division protein FtsX
VTGAWTLRRVASDLRRHAGLWLGLAAAFSVAAFGAAGLRAATRAPRAAPAVEPPAHVVAYLADDLGPEAVERLRQVLATLPDVEAARLVPPREALDRLRGELGPRASVVDGVGPDLMFTSIEVAARPASAPALAFRLRRVAGVADVDLVSPPAAPVLARWPSRSALAAAVAFLLLAVVVVSSSLARLRGRLRPELRVLETLGIARAVGARPALALATGASALGVGLGLAAAFVGIRLVAGHALPGREWAVGAAALLVVAHALARGALRLGRLADAR